MTRVSIRSYLSLLLLFSSTRGCAVDAARAHAVCEADPAASKKLKKSSLFGLTSTRYAKASTCERGLVSERGQERQQIFPGTVRRLKKNTVRTGQRVECPRVRELFLFASTLVLPFPRARVPCLVASDHLPIQRAENLSEQAADLSENLSEKALRVI